MITILLCIIRWGRRWVMLFFIFRWPAHRLVVGTLAGAVPYHFCWVVLFVRHRSSCNTKSQSPKHWSGTLEYPVSSATPKLDSLISQFANSKNYGSGLIAFGSKLTTWDGLLRRLSGWNCVNAGKEGFKACENLGGCWLDSFDYFGLLLFKIESLLFWAYALD